MVRRVFRKSVEQKRDPDDRRQIGENHQPAQKRASPKIAPTSLEVAVSATLFRTIDRNRVRSRQRSGHKAIVRNALMDLGCVSQHSCVNAAVHQRNCDLSQWTSTAHWRDCHEARERAGTWPAAINKK
jgi:hypothetical protein